MKSEKPDSSERLIRLREIIDYHRQLYHTDDNPEISDQAYDALVQELVKLEEKVYGQKSDFSEAVGSAPSNAFAKVKHAVRQWSFDNVFDWSELEVWQERLKKILEKAEEKQVGLTYVAEHKIDGLKVVLEYRQGKFFRALTRGDGVTGEDVTHTAKTIKTLPESLKYKVDLICVGEVWLGQKDFTKLNGERKSLGEPLFANPRNAAAGSLRQLDAEVTKQRALSLFTYDIDKLVIYDADVKEPTTQFEELTLLEELGLPVNKYPQKCQSLVEVEKYYQKWKTKHEDLPYGVDGVVVKLDNIYLQNVAGYTAKAPRFGIAYKFPAIETTTVVEAIELQVGRTGVVTPVAHLRPVVVDGSTVARATLHNEDQIKRLDIRVGDTVILRKAGDVIPEVVSVLTALRPKNAKPYVFPKKVPLCGGDGSIQRIPGMSAYRCVSLDSDFLRRQQLYYFVSKTALNIDGVGPSTIDALLDAEMIKDASDLFTLTESDFLKLEGFKAKSAKNAVEAIKKSTTIPLYRFIVGLSIDNVGEETAKLLEDNFPNIEALQKATLAELEAIHGVGLITGQVIVDWQKNKQAQTLVNKLLRHITLVKEESVGAEGPLSGKSFVFTGTLEDLPRSEAQALVKKLGATVNNSVTNKTDFVVVGSDPGSKAKLAERYGVKIISKQEFLQLVAG
ncbi:MAG: NAD-dependent DNA ligase LigA [Candidatus Paceibacterota bacterium]